LATPVAAFTFAVNKMYNMKKNVFAILLLMIAVSGNAQKTHNVKFTFGPELGFATGSFSNTHSIGLGGTVQLEVPMQEHTNFTVFSGYISYNGKSVVNNVKYKGMGIIPLRGGIKHYFVGGGLYGGLQLGVGFYNNYGSGTAFSYAPLLGYEFRTRNGKPIDITGRYDAYSKNGTISAFNFRLGFTF
jgi:hypothetical protein